MATVIKTVLTVFSLELSEEEAGVLRAVLRRTGRGPGGLRGVVNEVEEALGDAGIVPVGKLIGSICFDPEDSDEN